MKVEITIRDYEPWRGLELIWEKGHIIKTEITNEMDIRILGNQEGLTSLARHLLTLAQPGVPQGSHIHLDEWNSLEKDSIQLILEKI